MVEPSPTTGNKEISMSKRMRDVVIFAIFAIVIIVLATSP